MHDRLLTRRQSVHEHHEINHQIRPTTNVEIRAIKPDISSMVPISPRTIDVLRRAARKAGRKQVQIEKQMNSTHYASGRHSALPSARLGAVSAPPNLGQQLNKRLKRAFGTTAPPIFVVPASKCSEEEELSAIHVDPLTDDDITSAEEDQDDIMINFSDNGYDAAQLNLPHANLHEMSFKSNDQTPRVINETGKAVKS